MHKQAKKQQHNYTTATNEQQQQQQKTPAKNSNCMGMLQYYNTSLIFATASVSDFASINNCKC